MATPQLTKKGLYRVQIRRPTKDIHVDRYFATKRSADKYIRQVEHAIENDLPISTNVQGRTRFCEGAEEYVNDTDAFKTRKGVDLKPSAKADTIQRIQWLARKPDPKAEKKRQQTGGNFGEVVLKNLTWKQIDKKLSALAKEHEWEGATRTRYESALSRFLDYSIQHDSIALSANVMNGNQVAINPSTRERRYKDGEWEKLLAAADELGGMLGMFLRLSWETGARKSELLNLRWVDVEPVDQEGLGARLDLHDTKNREPRPLFISDKTYQLLLAHEQQYRRPSSALVFPPRNLDPKYRWKPDGDFVTARKQAGLAEPDEKYGENLTIHHIRHTWATRLGDSGATLAQLMSAGGWKTPAMAMRYMKRKETQAAEAALLLLGK